MIDEVVATAIRTFFVYALGLLLIRLASKRLLGDFNSFDFLVTIILGSTLSRGINGSASLASSLTAGVVIIALHWLASFLSFHFEIFQRVLEGNHVILVKNGKIDWNSMRKVHLSESDLMSQLRMQNETSISRVKEARMESSGAITFIMKKKTCWFF